MGEAGGDLELPEKATGHGLSGGIESKGLHGDLPVVPEILGQEDRGQSPGPDLPIEAVSVADEASEGCEQVHHEDSGS